MAEIGPEKMWNSMGVGQKSWYLPMEPQIGLNPLIWGLGMLDPDLGKIWKISSLPVSGLEVPVSRLS